MCKVEDCQKTIFSNGFCHAHYDANRKANAFECKIDECGDPSHSKGLCNRHYRKMLREDPNRERCSIDECKAPIHSNGLCTKHHVRLRRHGTFNPTRPKEFKGEDKKYEEFYRRTASLGLKRNYGITLYEYEVMLELQDGVCKICGEEETVRESTTGNVRRLAVDHCHDTDKVRGLLCSKCNLGIGYFKDSKDLLLKAIKYLDNGENK